jgi:hypothetical protein
MQRSTDQQGKTDATPTQKLLGFMARNILHPLRPIDFYEAMARINKFVHSCRQLSPTYKQVERLKAHGKWREGMTRGEAHDLIRQLIQADAGHPS